MNDSSKGGRFRNVMGRFAGLSDEEVRRIIKEAAKKAAYYEEVYHGCCEATLLGLLEAFDLPRDYVKLATGFAAGIGFKGLTCGALCGGVMAIGIFFGRSHLNYISGDPTKKRYVAFRLAKELCEKFIQEYGSTLCKDIQAKILGKWYDLWDPKQHKEFEEVGAHTLKGCPSVTANGARWAAELILNEIKKMQR